MGRRALVIGVAIVGLLAVPGPAGAASRMVSGSMGGSGHFVFGGGCGIGRVTGDGTFAAAGVGNGTYRYDVCIEDGPTVSGTLTFTTHSGAALTGALEGVPFPGDESGRQVIPATGGPALYTMTVTGGTRRYAHATGTLTVGPLAETELTGCNAHVGVCSGWHDAGPVSGTLRHVRHTAARR